uniref:Immunoglobulin domain-containing protein n=1 Tax=Echeneis naucrates TaxID=173247 RepID=A0A665VIL9_ECHNA
MSYTFCQSHNNHALILSWISVSESRTVDAQSGGDVTLLCSNISQETTQTDWFRLINGTKATCVSSMYRPDGPTSFCKGFEHGFEMSTNVTMIFLKIKRVNLSDSGFYFCGFYRDQHTVIAETTYLNVQGKIVFMLNQRCHFLIIFTAQRQSKAKAREIMNLCL